MSDRFYKPPQDGYCGWFRECRVHHNKVSMIETVVHDAADKGHYQYKSNGTLFIKKTILLHTSR